MSDFGTIRDVVLVGLGHAHLHVGARAAEFRRAGLRLTLIDDGTFWYSSIGSGLLGGRYERADDVIDAAAFAERFGIHLVVGRAVALDRERRNVVLESGDRVPYDLVSLNVGSRTDPPFPVSGDAVWHPKPIHRLLDLRQALSNAFASGRPVEWLTVGGNHSGCELTLNVLALARANGGTVRATLVTSGSDLVANEPPGAQKRMRRVLEIYGCAVRTNATVRGITANEARMADGTAIAFDHALVATGLRAAPLVEACNLPADERGLHVLDRLHAASDDRVFAAGDCARIDGYDLPKVGVFGVRAAPVLAANLISRTADQRLAAYKPQRIWFAAQNLGDGTGLASWGPAWWQGRSALAIKDWNDRRFMNLYRAPTAASPSTKSNSAHTETRT